MTFSLLQCSWFSFLTFLDIELKPRGWQTYIILSIVIFYSLLIGAGVETPVFLLQNISECYCSKELEGCGESLETDLVQQDYSPNTSLKCVTDHPGDKQ